MSTEEQPTISTEEQPTMSEDEAVLVEHPDRDNEGLGLDTADAKDTTSTTVDSDTGITQEETKDEPKEETKKEPEALQIVSIGTEEDAYAFTFHEESLNSILKKVPAGWKVSVVSVVGAFRTGKSFLLSWFLKYLHHLSGNSATSTIKTNTKWYNQTDTLGNSGFNWRGGHERNTTGIWMWSEPFFLQRPSGEQMAVVLVDTQGMFDHETTMALTASIFGLSTLLTSYQIYNVDKRIQEDNLQQLALFSEYARMAMTTHGEDSPDGGDDGNAKKMKPFQSIDFLVRDWQNFEEEEDLDLMEQEMKEYLDKAIADRDAADLQETRDQITSCFQSIGCYGLVHPGQAVTKKKYQGDVDKMDETFMALVDRYCQKVFDPTKLQPKIIHGRELTAVELASYVKAYAALFESGATFPEAATLLDATAAANNTNAVMLSMEEYKAEMNRIAGPSCSNYVKPEELEELHNEVVMRAVAKFKAIANFGSDKKIEEARSHFQRQVNENYEVYTSLNDSRNPLLGLET